MKVAVEGVQSLKSSYAAVKDDQVFYKRSLEVSGFL